MNPQLRVRVSTLGLKPGAKAWNVDMLTKAWRLEHLPGEGTGVPPPPPPPAVSRPKPKPPGGGERGAEALYASIAAANTADKKLYVRVLLPVGGGGCNQPMNDTSYCELLFQTPILITPTS